MPLGREALQREASIQHAAGREDTAAQAIGADLDELEALAAQTLAIRNRLRIKARSLYTASQVGDAQTSEAELVSAPLRAENARIRTMLAGAEQKVTELEALLTELRKVDEAPPAECHGVAKLTRQLDVARSEVSALQNRKAELHGRIFNLAEWLNQSRAEVERLDALVTRRDAEIGELVTSLQSAREVVTARDREIDRLNVLAGRLERDRDVHQAERQRAMELLATIERRLHGQALDDALRPGVDPADHALHLAEAVIEVREAMKGFS